MPFLTGFGKRKEIRYGTVFPGENLTDFPKLFVISGDTDIAAELAGGGGIAITEADETTEVPFGLYPSSDPTSGDLILRAKFSPLTAASTGDVMGYIYYDAGETTTEDKAGVVDNGYVLFMSMEEDPSGSAPQMFDWVSESNVGTSAGSMTSGDLVAGQVDNGLDFDGSDDVISIPAFNPVGSNEITVECHVKPGVTTRGDLVTKWNNGPATDDTFNLLYGLTSGKPQFFVAGGGGTQNSGVGSNAMSTGTWYSVAGVYGSGPIVYLNGVAEAGPGGTLTLSTGTTRAVKLANNDNGDGAFTGVLDEIRISSVARSADWLAYAYEDDFNNADTFTLGTEEVDGGGGGGLSIPIAMYHYQHHLAGSP